MAVQITAPAADFVAASSAPSATSFATQAEPGAFGEALAGAANAADRSGNQAQSQSQKNVKLNERGSAKAASSAPAADAKAAEPGGLSSAEQISGEDTADTTEPMTLEALIAALAQSRVSESEPEAAGTLNPAPAEAKPSRFDPDAILGDFLSEMIGTKAETGEEPADEIPAAADAQLMPEAIIPQIQTVPAESGAAPAIELPIETETAPIDANPPVNINSEAPEISAAAALRAKAEAAFEAAVNRELPEEFAAPDGETLVVGEDENGEVAVKSVPDQGEGDDAIASEQGAGLSADAGIDPASAEAKIRKPAERTTQQQVTPAADEPASDQLASVAEDEPKREAARDEMADPASDIDKKIAEIMEKYREERASRDGSDDSRRQESGESRFARAAKPGRAADGSRQNANRAIERAEADPARAAASRSEALRHDAPFGNALSSALREAADGAASAEAMSPSSRAGLAYALDRAEAFSNGLGTVLEFMKTDGTQEARIVVEPPALGHIDISLRATEAGLEARFKVDNDHLAQMVRQHLDILKSSLETQGIQVTSIAVDIRNRDDQKDREAANANVGKKGRGRRGIGGESDGEDEPLGSLVRLDLERGMLHWVA